MVSLVDVECQDCARIFQRQRVHPDWRCKYCRNKRLRAGKIPPKKGLPRTSLSLGIEPQIFKIPGRCVTCENLFEKAGTSFRFECPSCHRRRVDWVIAAAAKLA